MALRGAKHTEDSFLTVVIKGALALKTPFRVRNYLPRPALSSGMSR